MARNEILAVLARSEPVDYADPCAYWLLTNSERNDYSEPCHRRNWTTYLQFERDCDNQEEARVLFNIELMLIYFTRKASFITVLNAGDHKEVLDDVELLLQ